jgi:hypothetical protein
LILRQNNTLRISNKQAKKSPALIPKINLKKWHVFQRLTNDNPITTIATLSSASYPLTTIRWRPLFQKPPQKNTHKRKKPQPKPGLSTPKNFAA